MRAHLTPRSRLLPVVVASFAPLLGALPLLAEKPPMCRELAVSVLPMPPSYAAECGETIALPPPALDAPSLLGDDVFYLNLYSLGPNAQDVLKAPLALFTFTNVGPQTRPIFAMDFDNAGNSLWAIDNQTRELGTINQTDGTFAPSVQVTGIPAAETITGISFDRGLNPSLDPYVSTTEGSPAHTARLYKINMITGAATLVGPITGYPAMVDIAISSTGQMYGHEVGGDRIVGIDKATGAGTDVGSTGFDCNFAQGMDFDSSTNKLYLFMHLGASAQSRLASVNLGTGTATILQFASQAELEGAIKAPVPVEAMYPKYVAAESTGLPTLFPAGISQLVPVWTNIGSTELEIAGTTTNFTGPFGPTYTMIDSSGSYGEVASGSSAACQSPCYTVEIQGARPLAHWDVTLSESLAPIGVSHDWILHVGGSFADVPQSSIYAPFIESMFHSGITAGCGGGNYCPDQPVTRAQMAVFVVQAKFSLPPQPCAVTSIFDDVDPASPFCPAIEELSRRGITAGCGGNSFCPDQPIPREQMAVFIIRARFGPDYVPPPCTTPIFNDVPSSSNYCRWIEDLHRKGITAGCGNGSFCPTVPVPREQMSVFVGAAFAEELGN